MKDLICLFLLGIVCIIGGLTLLIYFIPKMPNDIRNYNINKKLTGFLSEQIAYISKQGLIVNIGSSIFGFLFMCLGIIILILGVK
jgi:hypothetical protein